MPEVQERQKSRIHVTGASSVKNIVTVTLLDRSSVIKSQDFANKGLLLGPFQV